MDPNRQSPLAVEEDEEKVNDELLAQIDKEEELEQRYNQGGLDQTAGKKVSSPGFAKQKQTLEQNRFYQRKKTNGPKINYRFSK